MGRKETRDAPARGWGKWSESGVPHKRWVCIDFDDLVEYTALCEMCESAEVRYVHVMAHANYCNVLRVGCVCAENMEADYGAARNREKNMRNRSARRRRFPTRKGWKCSKKGNRHITLPDGYWVCVYGCRHGQFGYSLKRPGSTETIWGRDTYATEQEAQLAAFDLYEKHAQPNQVGLTASAA